MLKKIENIRSIFNREESRNKVILFVTVFIISLVMCSAFVRPHYPQDTYKMINYGLTRYSLDMFLNDGRPFSAMITIFVDLLNIPINVYCICSTVIALILLSLTVVSVFKIIGKRIEINNKMILVSVLLISFITIYNYFTLEYIFFIETCVLSMGIYMSVETARIIIEGEKNKYIKAILVLIIGAFCYQGSVAIFPMIIMLYFLLLDNKNLRNSIKEIITAAVIYGLAVLSTIVFVKIISDSPRIQVMSGNFQLQTICDWLYMIMIKSLNFMPPYIHLGIIFITIITILTLSKNKVKTLLSYIFIILASICISVMPLIAGSGLEIEARFCIAYGATIGISLLFMFYVSYQKNKYIKITICIFIIVVFIFNFITYIIIGYQHIAVNKMDENMCQIIKEEIVEYEKETNIKVTKLAVILRNPDDLYYPEIWHVGDITESALKTWATRVTLIYYLDRDIYNIPITKEQNDRFFSNKQIEEFSKDRIVIQDDTLLFCGN